MVKAYKQKVFNGQMPVFDGRKNLYSRDPLPIGREKVSISFLVVFTLELEDIISVLQRNRLRWYGHVLRKEDNDWVKKYMEYEVEGTRPRGRPKETWREIVEKDCRARGLNTEDAMVRSRWRKQIGMIDDHDEYEWVNVSSGTGSPGLSRTNFTEL